MPENGLVPFLTWALRRLRRGDSATVRTDLAIRVWELREFARNAPGDELRDRLARELTSWSKEGQIAPVTFDRLFECLHLLESTDPAERDVARAALQRLLWRSYRTLSTPDPVTRFVIDGLRSIPEWVPVRSRRTRERLLAGQESPPSSPVQLTTPSEPGAPFQESGELPAATDEPN